MLLEAVLMDGKVDPVCGMVVDPRRAVHKAVYKEEVYYFYSGAVILQARQGYEKGDLENIAWAFATNITLIPIAAGLLYASHGIMIRPEMAALAMVLSDISVVANSVTLLAKRL